MDNQAIAGMKAASTAQRTRFPTTIGRTESDRALAPNRSAPNAVMAVNIVYPGKALLATCDQRAMATVGSKLGWYNAEAFVATPITANANSVPKRGSTNQIGRAHVWNSSH